MKLHTLCKLRWIAISLLLPVSSGCTGGFRKLSVQQEGVQQTRAPKKLTGKQEETLKKYLAAPLAKEGISEVAQAYLDELGGIQDLKKAYRAYLKRFGRASVSFTEAKNGALSVTITTKRLTITSVVEEDAKVYQEKLYGDEAVMKKYADCKTRGIDRVREDVEAWIALWKRGCPFASLTARHSETGHFISRVILEAADEEDGPNSAEKATMIANSHGAFRLVLQKTS